MIDEARIQKLQDAVQEHPNDELAQFSLGSALMEAGRLEEAGPCFQRVVAVNSQHSKAYELLGTVQKHGGLNDLAIQTLTNGYRVAQRRGDMEPMNAMASLLKELGAEVPAAPAKAVSPQAGGAGGAGFSCRRCGGAGPQLEKQPFKGELGEVVLGRGNPRKVADEVVICELTGMPIWDAAIAKLAYSWAVKNGVGTQFHMSGD